MQRRRLEFERFRSRLVRGEAQAFVLQAELQRT